MDEVRFTTTAWNHYLEWQTADKKMAARVGEYAVHCELGGKSIIRQAVEKNGFRPFFGPGYCQAKTR
jgi:hypothetical protein